MKKEIDTKVVLTHIVPIITPDWKKENLTCESCQASCQSACKTSCTVSNQPCPEK